MKILILEDNQDRTEQFRDKLDGHVVIDCDTAAECIARLNTEEWDWVFLDHDLGGQTFVDSGPNTGYEVAAWMREHTEKWPKHGVVIHSLNLPAADRMESVLPAPAWKIPFLWAAEDLIPFLEEYSDGNSVSGRVINNAVRRRWSIST